MNTRIEAMLKARENPERDSLIEQLKNHGIVTARYSYNKYDLLLVMPQAKKLLQILDQLKKECNV